MFLKSTSRLFLNLIGVSFACATAPSLQAVTVLTDVAGLTATGNWNLLSDANTGSGVGSVVNAIDSDGVATGISMAVTSRFNATNFEGDNTTGTLPGFAKTDSFYGNARAGFNGQSIIDMSTITLTGLDPATIYNFTFYAARNGTASDNRETRYILNGANSSFIDFNPVQNTTERTATITGIMPTAEGVIDLVVTMGPNNNNGTGFYYLGAMQIEYIPEPGSAILVLGSLGLVASRRRRL